MPGSSVAVSLATISSLVAWYVTSTGAPISFSKRFGQVVGHVRLPVRDHQRLLASGRRPGRGSRLLLAGSSSSSEPQAASTRAEVSEKAAIASVRGRCVMEGLHSRRPDADGLSNCPFLHHESRHDKGLRRVAHRCCVLSLKSRFKLLRSPGGLAAPAPRRWLPPEVRVASPTRRRSERRAELQAAAQRAMAAHGANVQLNQVAREAGLTSGAVLYHYPDLQELLLDAQRVRHGALLRRPRPGHRGDRRPGGPTGRHDRVRTPARRRRSRCAAAV